MKDQEREIKE